MLSVANLGKCYRQQMALSDLSFTIDSGDIVGLVGCNGAGKSTLLHLVAGLTQPDCGVIKIADMQWSKHEKILRSIVGFLPEFPIVSPFLSVKNFLYLIATYRSLGKKSLDSTVEKILSDFSLKKIENKVCSQLSLGQKQRVAIASAMLHDPKLVLLDEPMNGLDPVQISYLSNLILSWNGKKTVIISSHILGELIKICSSIILIHEGKLLRKLPANQLGLINSHSLEVICECQFADTFHFERFKNHIEKSSFIVSYEERESITPLRKKLHFILKDDRRDELARIVIDSYGKLFELTTIRSSPEQTLTDLLSQEK